MKELPSSVRVVSNLLDLVNIILESIELMLSITLATTDSNFDSPALRSPSS